MAPDEKKRQIINAAIEMVTRMGKHATIAKIAALAGVTDSILYHYFEHKEDLLFHAAGERIRRSITALEKGLQGIREPVERLEKMIWFQLYYHDRNPHYANFTIFECRSNETFFQHPSFNHVRHYARILKTILEDGVHQGVFEPSLCIPVARDIILGLLDMLSIQCYTGHKKTPSHEDVGDIMRFVLPMITPVDQKDPACEAKDKRILDAALHTFSRKGYQRATVNEIARTAQVSEGTLYEYFKNKEDILFSVLDDRLRGHQQAIQDQFALRSAAEKLRQYIHYHLMLYLHEPEFVKTFILNGIYNQRFYGSKAYTVFQRYLGGVREIISEGKAAGDFRPEMSAALFESFFLGAFSHMGLRWLFANKGLQIDKVSEIGEAVMLLMRGVARPPSQIRPD